MKHLLLFLVLVSSISAFAAPVPMQTTQDKADGNRLVINGNKRFISGMNIAWNNFGNDVGDLAVSINDFVNYFKQIKGAGGNAVRWWLHTDLRNEPKMNSDGSVDRIGTKTIDNIRQVLDSAYNYGIVVSLCLFSFDLLQLDGKNASKVAINKKFLTVPANLDSYITKVLKPMLEAVGNHPAIMCWEVFNEPEGMSSDANGWSDGDKVPMSDILRFTARIAAVVHDKTLKMASTGIHEFGKMKTWYSDSKLRTAAGSDPLASKAYLDFYMAHYYPQYIGTSGSPFHNTASSWGMDRPILIGEFPAKSWDTGYNPDGKGPVSGTELKIVAAYERAYDNGYCGALSWSMNQAPANKFGDFNTTKPALENLYSKHKADIDGVPVSGGQSSSSIVASSSSRASSSSVASSSSRASSSSVASSSSRASSSSVASSSSRANSSSSAISSSSVASSSSAAVSSSSSSTGNSSSSESNATDTSSSSEEDSTPIVKNSPLAASHFPTYYSLKGEPLGNAKPQKAGIYIVKQGYSAKKIVVR
ncbi:MAG: cellulase family glycosylhydrolase [Fibromonadaceae bacterium]|jgi:hypothetical protein|nr:cellulase family glycosylhydrolase [Fibromonadaceae bacterium]